MAAGGKPGAAVHLHCSGGKGGHLPVVLIHIAARVQGVHSGHLHLSSLHRPRSGIENMAGQIPDGPFRRAGCVHHIHQSTGSGLPVPQSPQERLFPGARERKRYGGIAKVIGKNGSGIQVSDGVQRQIVPIHVHHTPAVAEDELPGYLVFPRQAHHYSAAVQLHVVRRVAVPVQNQHPASSHVDVRRIVPVAADDQITFPDLPPLVPGGSGQQRRHGCPLVHNETRRIQTVGGISSVAQYVIPVEREGTRPRIHRALENNGAAGAVKNKIAAHAYLRVRGPRSLCGGISSQAGGQPGVIRTDISLNEGSVSVAIRHIPQKIPTPFRHADGAVETVHVIAGPLVARAHLAELAVAATALGLTGPHPFPSAGLLIKYIAGTSAVPCQYAGRQGIGFRRFLEIVPETVGRIGLGILRVRLSCSRNAGLSLKNQGSPGQIGITSADRVLFTVPRGNSLGSGPGTQNQPSLHVVQVFRIRQVGGVFRFRHDLAQPLHAVVIRVIRLVAPGILDYHAPVGVIKRRSFRGSKTLGKRNGLVIVIMGHGGDEARAAYQSGFPGMGVRQSVKIHHFGDGAHVIAFLVVNGDVFGIDSKDAPVFRKITVSLNVEGIRHQSPINGREETGRPQQAGMIEIM